jgi:hypothetical protein
MREEVEWKKLDREALAELLYENIIREELVPYSARKNIHNYYSCLSLDELTEKVVSKCGGKLYVYKAVRIRRDKVETTKPKPVINTPEIRPERVNEQAQVWKMHAVHTELLFKSYVKQVAVLGPGVFGVAVTDMKYENEVRKILDRNNMEGVVCE